MVAVLLTITGGSVYLGSVVVARHRAQAAADLAALAAAARLAAGPETACAQAKVVARQMRVSSTGCTVDDLDVVVTTEVRLAVGGWGSARAAARAGPAGFSRALDRDRIGRRRQVRSLWATAARPARRMSSARLPPG
jgi:secretion/DNA translocation related TadE-like protein